MDNEGTKFCMMKGASENGTVDIICAVFAEIEAMFESKCWLARVPSKSNIADKPSRGDVQELIASGFSDETESANVAIQRLLHEK